MIDIHCHILPGIDDGAESVNESIKMAKAALKEGIHTIVATPHHKNGKYDNTKISIIEKVTELNQIFLKENISLAVLPGQETRINGEMIEDMAKGEILSLNQTQYVFVELPSSHVPRYTERLLFDIQLNGHTPIIVHPERNQEIIERPDVLYNLVKKGTMTQITASSLTGYFGKRIKSFSLQLIASNLAHFISSDAHNVTSRTFKMTEALDSIDNRYGVDMVYFFIENAQLLIEGKYVSRNEPIKFTKKKFLGIF